ncbi:MAG TPA: acyl-CoA dehydrogenase family protein, partial [Thermoanaerobaculia bacterium]|nr:acyl-CoA dehydrogenase family protein [Thermoanaerobaculia bacterium]
MAFEPLKSRGARSGSALPDPLERVASLAPLLAASADETERERRLPERLLAAMHEAEMFRLLLPRPMGGAELDPPSFVRVIEEIAKLDASTAWCLCQNDVCSMVAAFLAPEPAREIFGRDPKAVLAWGPGPNARATAVEGGYRITGSFAFASGGRHATWLGAFCSVYEADGSVQRAPDGTPAARTMLFPAEKATMRDIWHVIGLRGTASDAYSVDDLFVPEAYTIARDDQSERRCRSTLYALPTNSIFSCGFACVALGLARALLDAFSALALEKTPRGYKSRLRESAVVQSDLAEAEARLRGARMYLMGTLGEIWANVERRNAVTLEERMAIRLAATHTIHEATRVADTAY